MRLSGLLTFASLALQGCNALAFQGRPYDLFKIDDRDLLQDVVTFDEKSLFINGERLMIFSGEVHPFRLPVPSLWLDIFQKVKALGLNTVSFYVHWGALEGKQGNFTAEGVFAYEPFFAAAKEAGIYLLARPGPYINAEATGGGYPGWLQRIQGKLRTSAPDYLAATDNYMANIGKIIAAGQITNGGPIILVQPENEYTQAVSGELFPDPAYMQYVEDQLRNAGVVVPLINNDASASGHNAPGTGEGEVDIYGHDGYPLGFDCANPYVWPAGNLPVYYRTRHLQQSPTTPYSIVEFQGGSFDPPGGLGFDQCSILLNMEFERVFYKNNYAAGVTIFNLYMIFGGTNWGNIGHPGGYTSYDYGSVIRENRAIDREKYSELKLQAQFLKVSPGYLLANASTSAVTGVYSPSTAVNVTSVSGPDGSFFVVRHTNYSTLASTDYTLRLPTSIGNLTIPQLGGSLSLNGRDSKVHVTDYPVGNHTLIYSTAEVFTWQKFEDKTVLVVYGGPGELHELAVKGTLGTLIEGGAVKIPQTNNSVIAQWTTSTERRIIQVDDLYIYILDRNTVYNFWVPELADGAIIVNGPYLVRSASVNGDVLSLQADFNKTATIEIIGVPSGVTALEVNGESTAYTTDDQGSWLANGDYEPPTLDIPELSALDWLYIDSLPEIQSIYDDSAWPDADHTNSSNPFEPLYTPTSLFAADYGFNTGAILLRGHFTSLNGSESILELWTRGGQAYGFSAWLDDTFLGSNPGIDAAEDANTTFTLPNLVGGKDYVITVLIDQTGLDENYDVGADQMKSPRGILSYAISSGSGSLPVDVAWKITGNLGGEDYQDYVRGPLNEGGLFIERQGYHQPEPPVDEFTSASPYDGITSAGVAYYTAKLTLDLPSDEWDVPLAFTFENSTDVSGTYRALLYVNGYQFGRYTSNIGPQTEFPVPEGILDYSGDNWIGLTLWALESEGAKVPGFNLTVGTPVRTGRESVVLVDIPAWTERAGAY